MPETNVNDQPAQKPANEAAVALRNMRFVLEYNRPHEQVSALALVAIAEQLALMNQHMVSMAVDVGFYVSSKT